MRLRGLVFLVVLGTAVARGLRLPVDREVPEDEKTEEVKDTGKEEDIEVEIPPGASPENGHSPKKVLPEVFSIRSPDNRKIAEEELATSKPVNGEEDDERGGEGPPVVQVLVRPGEDAKPDKDGLITHGNLGDLPHPPIGDKTYRVATSLGKENEDPKENGNQSEENVSQLDLEPMFLTSGKGSSTLASGCNIPHFTVKSRCSGNLLELTLSTRNPVEGEVTLKEADESIEMEGESMVLYGILVGRKSPSSRAWKLLKNVPKSEVKTECNKCDSMSVRVLFTSGSKKCGVDVWCQQKGPSRIVELEQSTLMKAYGKGSEEGAGGKAQEEEAGVSNTAKTIMNIMHGDEMEGVPVTQRQPLGTKMSLVLSVLTKDFTLDLHVISCEARSEDGSAIVLVQDGCSTSRVMGEFREVLGMVHDDSFGDHTVRKVTQFATFYAFNTKASPQTMTLICNIKMCGGECAERPACVRSDINLGRGKRPPVPLFEKAITLGKVFQVYGLPQDPTEEMEMMILTPEAQDQASFPRDDTHPFFQGECVPPRLFYIAIATLTGIYLVLLVICIYCVRRSTSQMVTKRFIEDYESPPRSLYQEYSSPRKRTPPTATSSLTAGSSPTSPAGEYISYSLHSEGRSHQN